MLAAALIACSLPAHTLSFKIDLHAYRTFAYVERHQYPQVRKQFYEVKSDQVVEGVRLGDKPTLEVFWIRGPAGFGVGGESGSELYNCQL